MLHQAQPRLEQADDPVARSQPAERRQLRLTVQCVEQDAQPFAEALLPEVVQTGALARGVDQALLIERRREPETRRDAAGRVEDADRPRLLQSCRHTYLRPLR